MALSNLHSFVCLGVFRSEAFLALFATVLTIAHSTAAVITSSRRLHAADVIL